jgi:hypothetical protein
MVASAKAAHTPERMVPRSMTEVHSKEAMFSAVVLVKNIVLEIVTPISAKSKSKAVPNHRTPIVRPQVIVYWKIT